MEYIQELHSRHDLMPEPLTCMIQVLRDGSWHQQRPIDYPLKTCQRIIGRLKQKGREVRVTWITGI